MLVRIANHIREIESNRSSNKYIVLRQARAMRFNVAFDVLYYAAGLLEEEIDREIGEKEGQMIRELKPVLNYQVPREDDYRKYSVNKEASSIRLEDIVRRIREDKAG